MYSLEARKSKSGHKEHYCGYCEKFVFRLPRHLERHHEKEDKVQQVLQHPSKSKDRRDAWSSIRRVGDYKANIEALRSNSGKVIVARAVSKSEAHDFVPCKYCNGFFFARTLYKHEKSCPVRIKTAGDANYSSLKSSRALLDAAVANGSFDNVHKLLFSAMNRDESLITIRNDQSLLLYGAVQLRKTEPEGYCDIRTTLRALARMLEEFRKLKCSDTETAKSMVMSDNFDVSLQAALNLAGYEGPRKIKKTSVISKLGCSLKNLAEYLRSIALRESDQVSLDKIRNFLELYDTEWRIYISHAKATSQKKKSNAPEELPLEADVRLFRIFVIEEIQKILERLDKSIVKLQDLKDLSKYAMARIMTFNARRGGEPAKVTLEHWEAVEDGRWKRKSDIENLDDPVERKLASRLKLCYVEGKKKKEGTKALVPILFTDEVCRSIHYLIKFRETMGFGSSNPYVFAAGSCYLKGWDTLQGITKKIDNLKKPALITPTRTRKYLATVLQLLDMNHAELTWLTNHFDHTKNVHFAWYRREDSTIELTKVARVLMAVDEGKEIKNKKIDEILEGEENIPEKLSVIQNSSSDSDGDSKTLIYLSICKKYHIEVLGLSQLNPIHHLNSLPLL